MSITGPCKVAVYPRLENIQDYSGLFVQLPALLTMYKNLMERSDYLRAVDVIGEIASISMELVSITGKTLLKSHLGGCHEYEASGAKTQPTQKEIHARLRERINNLGDSNEKA